MSFEASRPDPARLSTLPFGDVWLELVDPADLAVCDPMDVRVRLGMYRHLVERAAPGRFGVHDEHSPFWGYASQLAWQHRSGRLGAPAAHTIADGSWWGACNFALSVVPYIAAMQRGLVPLLRVDAPGYERTLPLWHDAFAVMADPHYDDDRIRVALWRAHLASITLAVSRNDTAFRAMPAAERRFATGWVRMVDLFAASAVRTDLEKLVETGGGALPSRLLREHDLLDGLHRHEVSTVRRVGALADRPAWRWAIEVRIWRRIMRTHPARADAERLLAGMLGRSDRRWRIAMRAIAYAMA